MKMKAVKITLASIIAIVLFVGLSNTAWARTHVSVGVGFGHPGFHHGGHGYYGHGWGHRNFHRSTVIVGGFWGWPGYYPGYYYPYPYSYDPYPDYYVVQPPPVVAVPPPVIEQQPVVQPIEESKDTQALFESLRTKKNELLKVLVIGDKSHRISAIAELAGYSFDDNVRLALEKVLLSDTDPELRLEAAKAFGEVKNLKAIPALEQARVQDSVTDVRKAADLSLKKLQGN